MTPHGQYIPAELQTRRQWVLWRKDKQPRQPNGIDAKTDDNRTWSTYDRVRSALKTDSFCGVGFVFSNTDPYIGIDFDECFPVTDELKQWLGAFASYCEVSQSGKGLHVLIRAEKGFKRCQWDGKNKDGKIKNEFVYTLGCKKIEIYDSGRFFALTGNLFDPAFSSIQDRQDVLNDFFASLMIDTEPQRQKEPRSPAPFTTTDEFIQDVITVLQEKGQGLFDCYEDFRNLMYALKAEKLPFDVFDSIVCHSAGYHQEKNRKIYEKSKTPYKFSFGTAYYYAHKADPDYLKRLFDARKPKKTAANPQTLHDRVKHLIHTTEQAKPEQDEQGNLTYTLQPGQYLSDLPIEFDAGFTLLQSETGTGKTTMIAKYADTHPGQRIVALYPTKFILEQQTTYLTKQGIPVNEVSEGKPFDYTHTLHFSTIDSFVEKYDPDLLPETVVFYDEFHCVISAAALNYKGHTLRKAHALLHSAQKVIGLTATPISLYDNQYEGQRIMVLCPFKLPHHFQVMTFEDPLKAIEEALTPGKVTFVEINSKDTINKYAKYFKQKGQKVGTIYRTEEKHGESPLYAHIKDQSAIPAGYDLILTTSLFELGIDVKGCSVGNVLIFPHKRLDTRHQTETVTAPHEVKQYINRFRDTRPDHIYLMRPVYQVNRENRTFDGNEWKAHFNRTAILAVNAQNLLIEKGKFFWHINQVRNDISDERAHLMFYDRERKQFQVNPVGIDFVIYQEKLEALTDNFTLYIEQLTQEGLVFDGMTDHVAHCNQAEKAMYEGAKETIKAQKEVELTEELDELQGLTWKELEALNDTPVSYQYKKLSSYFGREMAPKILIDTKADPHEFSVIQKRVHLNKYLANTPKVDTFDALQSTFTPGVRYTAHVVKNLILSILMKDRYLSILFTGNGRIGKRMLTTNRAVRILRIFYDVQEIKSDGNRFYGITSNSPLHDYIQKLTGVNLRTQYENIRYNLLSETPPETCTKNDMKNRASFLLASPDNQAEREGTFENRSLIDQSLKSVPVLIAEELSEYARDQLRIFGRVF